MIAAFQWGSPLGIFAAVTAALVLLGGAYAFFRQGYSDKTVEQLKENNAALHENIEILEGRIAACGREEARLVKELEEVRAEKTALYSVFKDLINGRS